MSSAHSGIAHHITKAVLPVKENEYRPRLIGRYWLFFFGILLTGVYFVWFQAATAEQATSKKSVTAEDLLIETNEARAMHQEEPLELNDKLSRAAANKAADMIDRQYWEHTSPDGVEPWKWVQDAGYEYLYAGENLARDYGDADAVVQAWLDSPTHRKNVLHQKYTDVGFAVKRGFVKGKQSTFIVAMYGTPAQKMLVDGTVTSYVIGQIDALQKVTRSSATLPPEGIMSIVVLCVLIVIALVAHTMRSRLPEYRQGLYRHHAVAKSVLLTCALVVVTVGYSFV